MWSISVLVCSVVLFDSIIIDGEGEKSRNYIYFNFRKSLAVGGRTIFFKSILFSRNRLTLNSSILTATIKSLKNTQ